MDTISLTTSAHIARHAARCFIAAAKRAAAIEDAFLSGDPDIYDIRAKLESIADGIVEACKAHQMLDYATGYGDDVTNIVQYVTNNEVESEDDMRRLFDIADDCIDRYDYGKLDFKDDEDE